MIVEKLDKNEIFVFGSNMKGIHSGGAARAAMLKFGAESGVYYGMTGQSFAIPTCKAPGVPFDSPFDIYPYVDDFLLFAENHPQYTFLVTPIGTGIAGFSIDDVDSMFQDLPFNVICLWRFEDSKTI